MKELPKEALNQINSQIEIIKNYAMEIDASQGLVANAITQLTSAQYAQAISNSLNQIAGGIQMILSKLPEAKPEIIIPR